MDAIPEKKNNPIPTFFLKIKQISMFSYAQNLFRVRILSPSMFLSCLGGLFRSETSSLTTTRSRPSDSSCPRLGWR